MNFCDTLKVAISKLQEPQEGVIVPEHILTFADKLSAVAEDDPSSLAGRVSPALQAVLSMVMEKTPAKLSTETKDQLIHWFGLTQLTRFHLKSYAPNAKYSLSDSTNFMRKWYAIRLRRHAPV